MSDLASNSPGFVLKDCALASIALGRRAQNLRELRDALTDIHQGCIYYHFWGGLLRSAFSDPEYNNDFAAWARHGLNDLPLAERLAVIDPTDFRDIEDLRREVIEVLEERLDQLEHVPWAKSDRQFQFIRSQIVIFDRHHTVNQPEEFCDLLPTMSSGSVFYHFIDARRRTEGGVDDFRAWMSGLGAQYTGLCHRLAELEPYFQSLADLRRKLTLLFKDFFEEEKA